MPDEPPRPPLAFRVGVTGARDLDRRPEAVRAATRRQVEAVLGSVRGEVAAAGETREARSLYGAGPHPSLRLLSPLAEGADRLVAEVAVALGYELRIALPFARADYANDFAEPASRAAFDRWLGPEHAAEARPFLALDGGRGDAETASYEAVGRLVVRNCDLLVAIWDGRPARGRGGTGDIVRFALRFGVPVWWIDADGAAPPRLLRSAADLRAPADAPQDAGAAAALAAAIRRMLLPARRHRHGHSLVATSMRRFLRPTVDPLDAYLRGRPLPRNPFWRLYGLVYRVLGGPRGPHAPTGVPVPDPTARYWDALYGPADRASRDYADRYRSSYVWIFLLGTLAVACAVLGLADPSWKLASTACEAVLLGLILLAVAANERHDWHGRWIACRLLAELCRKQGALAALGWSLPPPDLRRSLHADGAEGGHDEHGPPEAWVAWYFDAANRAAPLPRGYLGGPRLAEVRDYVRTALVGEQQAYHEDRRVRSRRAGLRLVRLGELAFFATLLLVLAKLALLAVLGDGGDLHALAVTLGATAAVLPATSAAFFGIRAYAELELLESQSSRMERVMAAAGEHIDRLDLSRPLASQDLAAAVLDVSSAMLQEVGGWADLFRVKAVEAG